MFGGGFGCVGFVVFGDVGGGEVVCFEEVFVVFGVREERVSDGVGVGRGKKDLCGSFGDDIEFLGDGVEVDLWLWWWWWLVMGGEEKKGGRGIYFIG